VSTGEREIRGPTSKEIVHRGENAQERRAHVFSELVRRLRDGALRRFIKRDVERRDKLPLSSFAFTPRLNR